MILKFDGQAVGSTDEIDRQICRRRRAGDEVVVEVDRGARAADR